MSSPRSSGTKQASDAFVGVSSQVSDDALGLACYAFYRLKPPAVKYFADNHPDPRVRALAEAAHETLLRRERENQ